MKFVKFGFEGDCSSNTVLASRKEILRLPHVRLCAALEPEDQDGSIGECYGVSLADEADASAFAEAIRKLPGIAFAEAQ